MPEIDWKANAKLRRLKLVTETAGYSAQYRHLGDHINRLADNRRQVVAYIERLKGAALRPSSNDELAGIRQNIARLECDLASLDESIAQASRGMDEISHQSEPIRRLANEANKLLIDLGVIRREEA